MSVSRLPAGINTRKANDPLNSYTAPDPTDEHRLFDDFNFYTAAAWTVTAVGTSTAALTNADGGVILLTTGASNNDAESLQKTGEGFSFETGKQAWFKCRFKVSTLATVAVIGLQITDTTPEDVTDGIYFLSTTGTGALTGYVRKNATTGSATASAGTLVADTWTELAWFWDGKDTVTFYQDGVAKGSVTGVAANYLPDATTTVSFGVRTTSANARTMQLDYVFASKTRR